MSEARGGTPHHSPHASLDFNPDTSVFSNLGAGGGGLGNLADELADAGLSDEDGEYYEDDVDASGISVQVDDTGVTKHGKDGGRDSGVDVESPPGLGSGKVKATSPGLLSPDEARGQRRTSSDYDGSEYGSESDLESTGMPPSLVARIDAVESLARRGTETTGSTSDGVFGRVIEGLRDLGSQSGLEGGATRLITAHSALTTHLNHQTRQLHSLTFPLLSPLLQPPDAETIDSLLPMLVSLAEAMPRPQTNTLTALTALHTATNDMVQTLNYLSDTLHMSRQTTTTATRRLRSAKELVADMRREDELREEGELFLTRGNWGERLRKRECANVCGEVVGGFEEVCNGWRAKLLAQVESSQA